MGLRADRFFIRAAQSMLMASRDWASRGVARPEAPRALLAKGENQVAVNKDIRGGNMRSKTLGGKKRSLAIRWGKRFGMLCLILATGSLLTTGMVLLPLMATIAVTQEAAPTYSMFYTFTGGADGEYPPFGASLPSGGSSATSRKAVQGLI
jgi:hypothetical protein